MDIGLGTIALLLGGIALYLLLRSYSTVKIEPPPGQSQIERPIEGTSNAAAQGPPPETQVEGGVPPRVEWPEDWEATYMGEPYTSRSYDGVTVTVSIEVDGVLPVRREINARLERPRLEESSLAGDINALLYMGANYVDVGYNTSWVAAEFPISMVKVDRPLAERAVTHLIRIRDAAMQR